MTKTKQVPTERWLEHCGMISNGKNGSILALSSIDPEAGYEVLAGKCRSSGSIMIR